MGVSGTFGYPLDLWSFLPGEFDPGTRAYLYRVIGGSVVVKGLEELTCSWERGRVCVLLLQDLLQSCSRGGGRRVEDRRGAFESISETLKQEE